MGIFGGEKTGKERKIKGYVRRSKETQIEIGVLNVDGQGESSISTTIGFLDHMITLFAYHGYFDIELTARGDTHVDNHHLNEDIGIALGEGFREALGDCRGIARTASAAAPMDAAIARVSVDISNRPAFVFDVSGVETSIKDEEGYSVHYGQDFLESFAKKMAINLHVEVSGKGDMHHYFEAVFKAFGMAMDKATRIDPRRAGEIPSSKGIL